MDDETPQRGITREFEAQLTSGILLPLLERVRHDDTLSLEIRNGYIDIYYRGGRLLGLRSQANATKFLAAFDEDYYYHTDPAYRPALPERPEPIISSENDARSWLDVIAAHKQVMDVFFSAHPKIEREYQQAVVRDNNRHSTGEVSDYVVIDIEYAQSPHAFRGQTADYRFDMVGFRWPAKGKSRASGTVTPVIMEMKQGDGSLTSRPTGGNPEKLAPGLAKHVRDIERFLTPASGEAISKPYALLREELLTMFETKQRLGLPSLPKNMRQLKITEVSERPEVLFILANHHPRSRILAQELAKLPAQEHADYGVATVMYAGYALFAQNVIPLHEFDAWPIGKAQLK